MGMLKQWESFQPNLTHTDMSLENEATSDEIDVAYRVDKYQFKYEPLYVAKSDTPIFDERFIGFGMTRNTQVYEMYVANYSFYVLDNAFASHWGFQTLKDRPEWRARQQTRNYKNIKVAYGKSDSELNKENSI